ncbi:pectate lyase [Vigna unguiculata]|uniref:Pectate lyase n=1 Tax=Vigna unguiculata TaxID=3917 RepID=A0A4D6L1U9_VIGUN|nr:pectate lyase [Vigna unguiculata]
MRRRSQLATCSVGYAGKMINNIGNDLIHYKVTDSSDDPINPKPNTLRYGASIIQGKVWITFQKDMIITLEKPLLISSFTTIDGRGVNVHIANNACLMIFKATNIIIHNIRVHHCKPQAPGIVMGPKGKVIPLGHVDGDAIRLVTASKIWIDHNTLYDCQDGLLDVTRGSTDVTISNNWFKNQDKVILLGHDDGYVRDKNMKVTVMYNHFGPNCNQRMPRIRHGYAHVANNLYQGWLQYAIGGSMEPSLKSEANLFVAPTIGNKEAIHYDTTRLIRIRITWLDSADACTCGGYLCSPPSYVLQNNQHPNKHKPFRNFRNNYTNALSRLTPGSGRRASLRREALAQASPFRLGEGSKKEAGAHAGSRLGETPLAWARCSLAQKLSWSPERLFRAKRF